MGNAQQGTGCCSSGPRAGGFTCLPNWLFGQATAQELVVLLVLQYHAPNIRPSLAALARESGLGKSTVCRTLAALKDRGWLRTERQFTTEGRNCPTTYHLMIQRGKPKPSAIVPERDKWLKGLDSVVPERDKWLKGLDSVVPERDKWLKGLDSVVPERDISPLGTGLIVPEREGDCPRAGHEQEEEKNKTNPTAYEPPLPPAAQGALRPPAVAAHPCRDRDGFLIADPEPQPAAAAEPPVMAEPPGQPQPQAAAGPPLQAPAAVQPQPQQQNPPRPLPDPADPEATPPVKPKARKREAGFVPTVEDVPAALLPVQRELLAFWGSKGGKRTARAWSAQMGQLQRIQDDQGGGTEAVRAQLEAGSEAAVFGRPWQAVTFANWERYGRRVTPIAGGGFAGKRQSQTEAGAQAAAFIRERDARLAAQAAHKAEAITIPALWLAEVA